MITLVAVDDELLIGSGSIIVPGSVRIAELIRPPPCASGDASAESVYVTVELGRTVRVSIILPVPNGVLPLAPPVAIEVHDTLIKPTGIKSVKTIDAAVLGPSLLTTIV